MAALAPDAMAVVEVKAFLELLEHSVSAADWARCRDAGDLYADYRDHRAIAAVGRRT